MKLQSKKNIDYNLVLCIFLSLITAAVSLGWAIVKGHGIFTVRDDFVVQQIPFTVLTENSVSGGIDGWCWNLDLGTSLINGFSFYTLGSPFFWLASLFPARLFPYIVGYIYILKYAVAAAFSYLYIKLFVNDSKYAVIGALIYSFSGFQSTNLLFYHFHEVVAFFPLLLYGLEKFMHDKSQFKLFAFAVFINCLLNYYFFVQECVFLVVYFLFRFLQLKNLKKLFFDIIKCCSSALLGIMMAAALFLPNIIYTLGNTRSKGIITLYSSLPEPRLTLFILKGLLFPGEIMNDHSSIYNSQWSSTAAYLPLVGLSLVFAYIITKKDWLSKICVFMLTVSFIPLFSSGFLLFAENSRRWWFMMILIFAVASVRVIENFKDYKVTNGVAINAVLAIAFYLAVRYLPWDSINFESLLYHPLRFFFYLVLVLAGLLIILIASRLKVRFNKDCFKSILALVAVFSVMTTGSTLYFYKRNATEPKEYYSQLKLGASLPENDAQYRYNLSDNVFTMTGKAAGLSSFSSTVSESIIEFDLLFDYYDYVIRMNKNSVTGLAELLGGKYTVSEQLSETDKVIDTVKSDGKTYYIIEKVACPIGFRIEGYITEESLKSVDLQKRTQVLMSCAVVGRGDAGKVKSVLSEFNPEDANDLGEMDVSIAKTVENATDKFKRNNKGFTCESSYDSDSFIYFTVPYDKGWTAYIDGEKTEIINSGGMMLLPVSQGKHRIEFCYSTPYFKMGLTIALAAWIVFIGLVVLDVIHFKKQNYAKVKM